MTRVALTGRLVCVSRQQAAVVARYLPEHIELTRAEEGCVSFDVRVTKDPLVWDVAEVFVDRHAFESHQKRVRASTWGRATAEIRREYIIDDDDS